jgi:hypothetical protein
MVYIPVVVIFNLVIPPQILNNEMYQESKENEMKGSGPDRILFDKRLLIDDDLLD